MLRRVALRLLGGLFMTVLVYGLVELGLRLGGYPTEVWRDSPLAYQSKPIAFFRESPVDGAVFVGARGHLVREDKRGLRVVVFGSSAAYGLGSPESVAFSGQLEHLLAAAMPPPVEVVNFGMPGFGSRQTAELLPQALRRLHPDLVLIYAGNNEFHELKAWKSLGEPGYPTPKAWERTAVYATFSQLLRRPEPSTGAPANAQAVDQLHVNVTAADRDAVDAYYAHQLNRMVDAAEHAGVPILLVTVADNLLRNITGGAADANERAALEAFERDRPSMTPEQRAERAASLPNRPEVAVLYAAYGRERMAAGDAEGARFYLERAERLDPDPARSTYTMRAALRQVGADRGAAVCDLAAALPAWAASGVPGPDLFWDHCHFTPAGNRAAAHILASCIARDGLLPGIDAAALSAADTVLEDEASAWRVDRWTGNGSLPERGSTATGLLAEVADGHKLFAAAHADRAFWRYDSILARGQASGALYLDRALARMHSNETDDPKLAGRTSLAEIQADLGKAAAAMPEDRWIQDLVALWQ